MPVNITSFKINSNATRENESYYFYSNCDWFCFRFKGSFPKYFILFLTKLDKLSSK